MTEHEPTEHEPQDLDERLRAADPAASAPEPDIAAIRARVRYSADSPPSNVVPLRRRRRALAVGAAAACACLLAATAIAGGVVGRATAPQADELVVAEPSEENSLPTLGVARNASPNQEMSTTAGSADAKMSVYPVGGTLFTPGPDVPDEPGTATGYRMTADGITPVAVARQLASALGVPGEPREQDGAMVVGKDDGSGPTIWVNSDPMLSWSYSDSAQSPYDCGAEPKPMPAESGTDVTDGNSTDAQSPQQCTPTEKPMSKRDALSASRKILASVGAVADPATDVDVVWEAGSDDFTSWVTAWRRVEGTRTQISWNFTFGPERLLWASGYAAVLTQEPGYQIVGAREAVLRSQDVRFSAFGPTPLDGGGVAPMATARGEDTATPTPGPAGSPGKVQVWMSAVTVTDAKPTLAQYWQSDGTLLLLPAYRLTTADDRGTWAVIAVDEAAVQWIDPETQG